jgi:bla regulator protein blaR1
MRIDAFYLLFELGAVTTASILVVGLTRRPLRHIAGARIAYWLWTLVPVTTIAGLLPSPAPSLQLLTRAIPKRFVDGLCDIAGPAATKNASAATGAIGLCIWALGCLFMFGLLIHQQRRLVRFLGTMTPGPEGTHYSRSIGGPMLVGVWRPRIVLPADFEFRYEPQERTLVLEHERTHLRRGDPLANAIASSWLCISWFNPFMYWGLRRFRLDQELACDAAVLQRSGTGRRRYAEALLKTQLTADPAWSMTGECRWESSHPLKERIAMIKRATPGIARQLSGILIISALAFSGVCAVWASHSERSPQADVPLKTESPIGFYADNLSIDADHISSTPNGEVELSGNVVITGGTLEVYSASAKRENGATVLEDVEIRLGDRIIRTGRALIQEDKISMDSAVISSRR